MYPCRYETWCRSEYQRCERLIQNAPWLARKLNRQSRIVVPPHPPFVPACAAPLRLCFHRQRLPINDDGRHLHCTRLVCHHNIKPQPHLSSCCPAYPPLFLAQVSYSVSLHLVLSSPPSSTSSARRNERSALCIVPCQAYSKRGGSIGMVQSDDRTLPQW